MPLDRYRSFIIATDYHLTGKGWVSGAPPQDRIESWTRVETQESKWSRIRIRWMPVWASPDIPRSERDKIRNRHGRFMGFGRDTIIEPPL